MTGTSNARDPVHHASWSSKIPGLHLASAYERAWLRGDLVAGIVLTALLVPQGMAYAELAGLPPVTGLYTTVTALLAYAAFGPSRILVVGPDSALSPLIAASILPLVGAHGSPGRAVALAGMLAVLMGAICMAAGFARLGTIAELLSKPVRVGYLNGIAVVVVVSQLPKLFGFTTHADGVPDQLRAFWDGVADGRTNGAALVIGVASLLVILGFRRWWPRFPGVLVAVVGATVAVAVLDPHGVAVVGHVPSGFPAPGVPDVAWSDMGPLVIAALGLAFVTLADSIALSRTFALKHGDHVDPNSEIIGIGSASVVSGFFQGFAVSASASRTAVAESNGAHTQMTGVVGAGAVMIILVAANGLVRNLPLSALAAVVIAAGATLFDLATWRWLWRVRRSELVLSVAAFLGVVLVGVLQGIAIAVVLSLANFLRRAWRPYDAVLGRIGDRKGYHDVDRHPEAQLIPGAILYRFDAPVFFANADYFADRVKTSIAARPDPIHWVIVAAEPVTDIDTTGAEVLRDLLDDLAAEGIDLVFAELKGPVKDRLRRYGLYDRIGDDRFFPTLGTAIDGFVAHSGVVWVDPVDESDAGESDTGPDT